MAGAERDFADGFREADYYDMEGGEDNEHGTFVDAPSCGRRSTPAVDSAAQDQLRMEIMAIHSETGLSNEEKAKKIQELMMSNWRKTSLGKMPAKPSVNEPPTEEDLKPTFFDTTSGIQGCAHYQRDAKLQANCCGGWFTCRFCHDEACDHKIERHKTENMMCMHCQTVQPANQSCTKCKRTLGRYYCDVCKFWDSDAGKHIYHCDKCNICRIGQGIDIDFFHCDVCACCLEIGLKNNHKCIEQNLSRDCPICGEYLFTSTLQCIYLRCSHIMHNKCYTEYITNAYQCPTCWKSLVDMKDFFRHLDEVLAREKMPPEYENYVSQILCNDCEKRSTAKYHFMYHKCSHCDGYNTRVLRVVEKLSDEDDAGKVRNTS